ncbi:hypothetical protein ACE6H2_024198 [Prunus campanulata]
MDQQNSTTSSTTPTPTPTPSTSQQPPSEPPTQSQPQPPPQSQLPPPSATAPSTPTPIPPSPNPNPNPKPSTPLTPQPQQPQPQSRPPSTLTRPWPQSHFAHFPSPSSSASSGPPPPPSSSAPLPPRGSIAIGVPAHHPSPSPPQPAPFSSSYGQHFGGLGRGGAAVPEPVSNSSASQVRPSVQGMQGMAMMGSLGSSSQMRPAGVSAQHPQRPVQSSFRPPSTASSQSPSSQNFQGHSLLRVSSVGTPSTSPNTSQGLQPHTQPWLSSGSQGKPPIPSPSYRQHMNSPSMQQRSHVQQQQHHPLPTASQQQHHPLPTAPQQQHHPLPSTSQQQHHALPSASPQQHHPLPSASQQQHHPLSSASQQQHHPLSSASQQQHHPLPSASQQQHTSPAQHQQPSSSHQGPEHFGQQVQPSRIPQTTPRQITRVQNLANQKSSSLASVQPNTVQPGPQNKTASAEADESCNRILSKRSIHELVNQIDPSEKLDPEVEDILMDIADEFVESITTFSCSLAKHRKSTTLEAKDILLHIEKNWNITLPGFGGDEIKGFRKPLTNDIHKERLSVIKKSIVATETANARSSTGQATGNAKGSLVKAPANVISSQNTKMREVT